MKTKQQAISATREGGGGAEKSVEPVGGSRGAAGVAETRSYCPEEKSLSILRCLPVPELSR